MVNISDLFSVYNKLATDCDGRVRELAHTCLTAVVTRVGRSLATCLKTLCGVWYLGRFDPHTPAASAANTAWCTAFPPHKQVMETSDWLTLTLLTSYWLSGRGTEPLPGGDHGAGHRAPDPGHAPNTV